MIAAKTTFGSYCIPEIDYSRYSGPGITDAERDKRLMALRCMKGKRESSEKKIEEELKRQGIL